MPNARLLASFVAALAFSLATAFAPARAEDIDIYALPNGEGFRPNVLIILDNTANWGSSISTPACDAVGAAVRASSPNGKREQKWAQRSAPFTS